MKHNPNDAKLEKKTLEGYKPAGIARRARSPSRTRLAARKRIWNQMVSHFHTLYRHSLILLHSLATLSISHSLSPLLSISHTLSPTLSLPHTLSPLSQFPTLSRYSLSLPHSLTHSLNLPHSLTLPVLTCSRRPSCSSAGRWLWAWRRPCREGLPSGREHSLLQKNDSSKIRNSESGYLDGVSSDRVMNAHRHKIAFSVVKHGAQRVTAALSLRSEWPAFCLGAELIEAYLKLMSPQERETQEEMG